jgi:hypothetical protein
MSLTVKLTRRLRRCCLELLVALGLWERMGKVNERRKPFCFC